MRVAPCPLYPQKRTLLCAIAMSAWCQKQTLQSIDIGFSSSAEHVAKNDDALCAIHLRAS
jgi:hypothetical protein